MEVFIDRLPGPTHSFGGLGVGNGASSASKGRPSNPRAAAIQSLRKMKLVVDFGVPQFVLPPQPRPLISFLRAIGHRGTEKQILETALVEGTLLLANSSASMWTANAATVLPACDCMDRMTHIVPANLVASSHRALEAQQTSRELRALTRNVPDVIVHDPLPSSMGFADEGSANYIRMSPGGSLAGAHLFAYGFDGSVRRSAAGNFPRQSRGASAAVSRLAGLNSDRIVYAQNSAKAIMAGAFHNDLLAAGQGNLLICHEFSYVDTADTVHALHEICANSIAQPITSVVLPESVLPLETALQTYFFNMQLITIPAGGRLIILPEQSRTEGASAIELLRAAVPDATIRFLELSESMANGGGPACLSLRAELTDTQVRHMLPSCYVTPALIEILTEKVEHLYPDNLHPAELADPCFVADARRAWKAIAELLDLGLPHDLDS